MIVCSIAVLLLVLSTGCIELKTAYIPPELLPARWSEATALKNTGIEFLGLEKWSSVTYEYHGEYDASLTITTLNTLVLTDENELQSYVNSTVYSIFENRTNLDELSQGSRDLTTDHTSQYMIYQGNNSTINQSVRIIGEVWNCGVSGISIMCLGFIFMNQNESMLIEESSAWAAIVGDPQATIDGHSNQGLIYSIKCH